MSRAPQPARAVEAGRDGLRERGSVTAELAVGLPAVVLLLVVVLTVAAAGMAQLRCADGARAGARAAALGSQDAAADARRVAGDGAQVLVVRAGGWATVTVTAEVGALPWGGGPLRARATASARIEPSAAGATP
ncbi:TadE family type IV pilus minor pilin [Cellulomonas edaphi]|uniref:TadE family type IV pilus minor pilin n=1 Tax=Cellulomonas edaphi TaxID=3053468 RepID=A0ABT7S9K0_9CELL|nr:TadE family type IV pilus minor pilin [Cellulomons edaphi]MDM7832285.1 TadE family type IV pilus minor pilin [Cellulomons edaphi]